MTVHIKSREEVTVTCVVLYLLHCKRRVIGKETDAGVSECMELDMWKIVLVKQLSKIMRYAVRSYKRSDSIYANKVLVSVSLPYHILLLCFKSSTIDEAPLHNAIVRAINEFYNCSNDVAVILKSATDTVLSGSGDGEIRQIEQRLKDIDQARNDFVNLIATGVCASNSLDDEFANLYSEEEKLSQKLLSLKAQANTESNKLTDAIKADIDNSNFQLEQYDDILVRKVIECVKILSKEEISVTFKGGYEIKVELLI